MSAKPYDARTMRMVVTELRERAGYCAFGTPTLRRSGKLLLSWARHFEGLPVIKKKRKSAGVAR